MIIIKIIIIINNYLLIINNYLLKNTSSNNFFAMLFLRISLSAETWVSGLFLEEKEREFEDYKSSSLSTDIESWEKWNIKNIKRI